MPLSCCSRPRAQLRLSRRNYAGGRSADHHGLQAHHLGRAAKIAPLNLFALRSHPKPQWKFCRAHGPRTLERIYLEQGNSRFISRSSGYLERRRYTLYEASVPHSFRNTGTKIAVLISLSNAALSAEVSNADRRRRFLRMRRCRHLRSPLRIHARRGTQQRVAASASDGRVTAIGRSVGNSPRVAVLSIECGCSQAATRRQLRRRFAHEEHELFLVAPRSEFSRSNSSISFDRLRMTGFAQDDRVCSG